jgi:hypothetical protein
MMEHKSDNLSPADSIEGGDFWTDLPEHVKQTIEKAKQQLDDGKGIPHQEVMDKVKAIFLDK